MTFNFGRLHDMNYYCQLLTPFKVVVITILMHLLVVKTTLTAPDVCTEGLITAKTLLVLCTPKDQATERLSALGSIPTQASVTDILQPWSCEEDRHKAISISVTEA